MGGADCFYFTVIFLRVPLFITPGLKSLPKRGNKKCETLKGTLDSDIGFCKSNENCWQQHFTAQEELHIKEAILPLWPKSQILDIKIHC